jgi:response regulator RpfG family c-di-GMP phosphodiesterase
MKQNYELLSTLVVLYIEEDIVIREHILNTIDKIFEKVFICSSQKEAMEILDKYSPYIDFIICDLKKFNFPNIKNIFQIHHAPKNLNNSSKNILLLNSVKINFFNSLVKPYKIENLLTEILEILK